MTRWALLAAVLALLLPASAQAGREESWRLVCDNDATASEPLCHVSVFTQDVENGSWLGVAVQILNGSPEVQVTSSGDLYRSAEIDGSPEVTTYTDYCYGSYCVFVHAEPLVEQFRDGSLVSVRLFNGSPSPSIEKRVSLLGFTKAYEEYLARIGE